MPKSFPTTHDGLPNVMQEFESFLRDLVKIPLFWVICGLFAFGQIYLFHVRRFGRKLMHKLFPRANKSLSARYKCQKSRKKIIVRYRVPANEPDELQIVIKTKLVGNFHWIDPKITREFGGYLESAEDESPRTMSSLFKLVSVNGETQIENSNALLTILREIKSLGFDHVQVRRKELILGNASLDRGIPERKNDLSELKRKIDQAVDAGLGLQKFLEENVAFVRRMSGTIIVLLVTFWLLGGVIAFWIVSDRHPLLDESQIIVPWLAASGVFFILCFLILSIRKKPNSVYLRILASFFLAVCMSLGASGPALYYNGNYDRSKPLRVEGKTTDLVIINPSSGKAAALFWMLGERYGNQVKALLAVPRVTVTLKNGEVYYLSISHALWVTLKLNQPVEVLIGRGALGWNWMVSLRVIA